MKIYTEIVYTWDDNKGELVEESSKSYDYEGPIVSCHWYHSHGGTITDIGDSITDTLGDVADTITDPIKDVIETVIPPDWSGWSDFSMDMATNAGYADPTNVPDWLREQWDKGADAFYEGLDTGTEVLHEQGGAAEDSINDLVGDTMDTGQGNLEGLLEDNNDTLLNMGDTFDYNVDQANAFVDNTVAVLGDTSSLINQGLGATIDINNPNALIVNPQGWYDDAFKPQGDAKLYYDWVTGKNNDMAEQGAENLGNLFEDYGDALGGMFGGLMDAAFDWGSGGGAVSRRDRSNAGDPFGNPSETRRLISEKKRFDTSPSLINAV